MYLIVMENHKFNAKILNDLFKQALLTLCKFFCNFGFGVQYNLDKLLYLHTQTPMFFKGIHLPAHLILHIIVYTNIDTHTPCT